MSGGTCTRHHHARHCEKRGTETDVSASVVVVVRSLGHDGGGGGDLHRDSKVMVVRGGRPPWGPL
jgi:hypothetical protein